MTSCLIANMRSIVGLPSARTIIANCAHSIGFHVYRNKETLMSKANYVGDGSKAETPRRGDDLCFAESFCLILSKRKSSLLVIAASTFARLLSRFGEHKPQLLALSQAGSSNLPVWTTEFADDNHKLAFAAIITALERELPCCRV
jgi:hypothetical protein